MRTAKSKVKQQENNYKKREYYQSSSIYFSKIHILLLSSSSKAINKHIITATISEINMNLLKKLDKSEKLGVTNNAPTQPAAKLVKNPDSTFNLTGVNKLFTKNNYSMILSASTQFFN